MKIKFNVTKKFLNTIENMLLLVALSIVLFVVGVLVYKSHQLTGEVILFASLFSFLGAGWLSVFGEI